MGIENDIIEMDFEGDMAIDPARLDVAWLEQPMLHMKYGRLEAKAIKRSARKAEDLKTRRSELILEARQNGEAKNAQQEEAYYRCHTDYKKLKAETHDAEHVVALLRTAMFTLNNRKAALENLVRLEQSDYFAAPQGPRDIVGGWEESQRHDRAVDRIHAAMEQKGGSKASTDKGVATGTTKRRRRRT